MGALNKAEPILRKLSAQDINSDILAAWYGKNGSSPMNFNPGEEALREHFGGLVTGKVDIWAALEPDKAAAGVEEKNILGLITVITEGVQYCLVTYQGGDQRKTAEVEEFAVGPGNRGRGIGKKLASAALRGTMQAHPEIQELYVMVHAQNAQSRQCFVNAGFKELVTYEDKGRNRHSTVLCCARSALPISRVIGIQSGNAVDGIDVCVVDFDEPQLVTPGGADVEGLSYKPLAFQTYKWPRATRERILRARDGSSPGIELARLDYELGECFAAAALQLLDEAKIDPATVDLVSSHGQSCFGHPHWELGELGVIAQRTGIRTAGDFRPADVAAGGNGSPCTCSFDTFMLRPERDKTKWRTNINIGGTTSMTFCPPKGSDEKPVGLDPGIGVFFMDLNIQAATGKAYDDGGKYAESGKVHEGLLSEMLQHPHYQRSELPISIGAEDFPRPLFDKWQKKSQDMGLSAADLQATLTELTARTLAMAAKRFGPAGKLTGDDIVVRGGVRFNTYFMNRLRANLSEQLGQPVTKLQSLDDLGFDEDSWETVMYAMFGFLCSRQLNNFVPSCTGAAYAVSGGKICPPGGTRPKLQQTAVPILICQGDKKKVNPAETLAFSSDADPEVDPILVPEDADSCALRVHEEDEADNSGNPFVRFRRRLYLYRFARALGMSDADWVEMVNDLDARLQKVDHGYSQTPLCWHETLGVWAKDETGQVGQSHKSRHFFLAMLYLQTLLRTNAPAGKGLRDRRLAVASCGNAAVGAATIAAAAEWPIDVFIPDDAMPEVVEKLKALGAVVNVCPKADNAKLGGDATVFACNDAVSKRGSIPFTLQNNGLAVDGTCTLIWEAIEQLAKQGIHELGSVFVQIGGGTLASGILTGLRFSQRSGDIPSLPTFYCVQADGCAPLARCHQRLLHEIHGNEAFSAAAPKPLSAKRRKLAIDSACAKRNKFMEVWENPHSVAHGLLDDETYDWANICDGMLETGGMPVVVTDDVIKQACKDARSITKGLPMCHTGSVGLAGVRHVREKGSPPKEPILVVFSGMSRGAHD
eukprot:gnl/TRDRNA2_/TRDRNA2_182116_c0_seq1.p1 gnl/TRDRNA2_/TRDRNA2_182116_c0~~gnl/TRDRNA2_/TRDRNA2_182116_c0_seq1.p1  ORF type:complete len:1044 (+),score=218.35 gnl/TRDRNA2_/TRDRNA2_182116_c0_seq1:21-3152(+)